MCLGVKGVMSSETGFADQFINEFLCLSGGSCVNQIHTLKHNLTSLCCRHQSPLIFIKQFTKASAADTRLSWWVCVCRSRMDPCSISTPSPLLSCWEQKKLGPMMTPRCCDKINPGQIHTRDCSACYSETQRLAVCSTDAVSRYFCLLLTLLLGVTMPFVIFNTSLHR